MDFHCYLFLFPDINRLEKGGGGNETTGSKIIFIKRGGQLTMGENDSTQVPPPTHTHHPLRKLLYLHRILVICVCYKGLEGTVDLPFHKPL